MPDQRTTFMPMDDPPHDRQTQPMPARGSGAAVIDAHERCKNLFPRLFRNAKTIVVHVDTALLRLQPIADAHLALGMAQRIAHQVLHRAVQVARLALDPGSLTLFGPQAFAP